MKCQKKVVFPALLIMAILSVGTLTAFAASTNVPNIEATQEAGSCIILGKDAAKEPDGVAKVSFDLGNTWLTESEALYSEAVEVEYWTFDEYQSYAKTVEQNLTEMLANNEPDLSEEDIQSWRQTSAQFLEFIKSGGKVSKNTVNEDSQLMVSALDNSLVGKASEK
jgi:hypothetical protein